MSAVSLTQASQFVLPNENYPIVWVIILNWNGLDDTLACIESLATIDKTGFTLEIVVVDNASDVDPRSLLATRFPEVRVIRTTRNLGFAGGCNQGADLALSSGADYVLLLNNDTLVDPDFLRCLVSYSVQHPETGLVAPLICHGDRPSVVQAVGGRVALALGHAYHQRAGVLLTDIDPSPIAVDYLSGCCLLVPAATIHRVGLFDERFFAYFEDVDLSLRVRQVGLHVVCLPESVIWHYESASTRRGNPEGTTSPMKHYLIARNRVLLVRKHGGVLARVAFFVVVMPMMWAFFLLALTAKRRWKKVVWYTLGVLDGMRGSYGRAAPISEGCGVRDD